jgi:hypothetical protein
MKSFWKRPNRAYRKMVNKHRAELIELAKADNDWDWAFLDDFVRVKIKHMYEYYSRGNNVYQSDESRLKIVDELKHVMDLYEELDNVWDIPDIDHMKREDELYEEIYGYIGCTIRGWWD